MKLPNKISRSNIAYNKIKDAVCKGELVPGSILSEGQLAEWLGMSRTPVREALRFLASEGFVEIRNGIGVYVKPLSSKDMEDLYEVRCLLELQAVKSSIYRISYEEIDDLEYQLQEVLASCERGETSTAGEFSELDWKFHTLLVERCTNNYIKSIIASNDSNLRRYQALSIEALNDVQESARQHLDILKPLRARNLPELLRTLELHLKWSANLLHNTI